MEGSEVPYLREALVFLGASVLVVPLFRWLKASPVLGFLAAGIVLGPHGFGIVTDADGVAGLGKLGVIFLLFAVGLELSFARLRALRTYVFGVGGLQVVVSSAVIGTLAFLLGQEGPAALAIGGAFALSSTAIVVQLLAEREEIATRFGRVTFGVLLLQDLAVVPLLVMLPLLGGTTAPALGTALLSALGRGVLAVVLIFALGRYGLRYLFRLAAWTRNPDLFMAMTLLAILATALATGRAGLSMELGAFLAGILLAETEFRHQIDSDIRPFRGLLLGVFFISVGMSVDLSFAAAHWATIGLLGAGLLAIKAVIATVAGMIFRLGPAVALRLGFILAGSGEFAFVLLSSASREQILTPEDAQLLTAIAGFTLLTIPVLNVIGAGVQRLLARRHATFASMPPEKDVGDLEGHVVIAGYGRVGRTVAQVLSTQNIPYVALDLDAATVARMRARHLPVFYGDATNADMLERVGIGRAAAGVITLDNAHATAAVLDSVRTRWPKLPVFVRARDLSHGGALTAMGPTAVVPETLEGSLQLSAQVLQALGTPPDAANTLIDKIRRENYADLEERRETKS